MSRNAEILASVSAASPNIRANYQGLLGYWCQAEAVFIETLQPEPSAAIAKYRQKLAAGEVAVGHNVGTDALSNLALRARLATLEAEAAAAKQELAEQEREKLALVKDGMRLMKLADESSRIIRALLDNGNKLAGELASRVGYDYKPVEIPPAPNPAGALPLEAEAGPVYTGEGHPNAEQQRAIKGKDPKEGTIWRRKHDKAEVIICPSTRWDSVAFRRHPALSNSDFNRLRYKKSHYFLYEYEPAPAEKAQAYAPASPLEGEAGAGELSPFHLAAFGYEEKSQP